MISKSFNSLLPWLTLTVTLFGLRTIESYDNKVLKFSGYKWRMKEGFRQPGPNHFTASPYVEKRRLHLIIDKLPSNSSWSTSEIYSFQSFGYGTYRWNISYDLSTLAPSVTLGLFTWDTNAAQAHREIDIEYAKWAEPKDPTNGQYVVQPHQIKGNIKRFTRKPKLGFGCEEFTWKPNRVDFLSRAGSKIVSKWSYTGKSVMKKGNEKVHMNLWLWKGNAPETRKRVDVIIESFEFIPLK